MERTLYLIIAWGKELQMKLFPLVINVEMNVTDTSTVKMQVATSYSYNVMLVTKKWQGVAVMPVRKLFTCLLSGNNN
jgi:hypothetical protein